MRFRHYFLVAVALGATAAPAGAATLSGGVIDCSTPLTHSVTLTADAFCALGTNGDSLVLGADHITVNLNGHSLLTTFGPVIESTGHRFDTIENGSLFTQGGPIRLTHAHHFTIRNVSDGGENGPGVWLTGGSDNRVVNSHLELDFGGASLQLTAERRDVVRNDTVDSFGCQVELDQTSGTRIVNSSMSELVLNGSSFNLVARNQITTPCQGFPPPPLIGISGTGNFNAVWRNVVPGEITLTGFGNWLWGNKIGPTPPPTAAVTAAEQHYRDCIQARDANYRADTSRGPLTGPNLISASCAASPPRPH